MLYRPIERQIQDQTAHAGTSFWMEHYNGVTMVFSNTIYDEAMERSIVHNIFPFKLVLSPLKQTYCRGAHTHTILYAHAQIQ